MMDETKADEWKEYIAKVNEMRDFVIAELKKERRSRDTEDAHISADHLLCQFLTEIGETEMVEAFEKVPKWYA